MRLIFAFGILILGISIASSQVAPDSPAKLISAEQFKISDEDDALGITGEIKVAVEVSKTGEVKDVAIYLAPEWPCSRKGDERIRVVLEDARQAVRAYKFAPAIKNGKPVDTRVGITLTVGRAVRELAEKDSEKDPSVERKPVGKIEGGVLNGKALSLPAPVYPVEARRAGARGAVTVRVSIDETGKVIGARAVEGHGLLQFVSRAAACQAKFSPTLLSGQPVKVHGVITYNFQ